nr:hypothetical protein [Tanacetum cinerariifolium]
MSLFNQRECLGYGQPCDGLYCYPCTCQQCGIGLTNGICLNYTYRDKKLLVCCDCEVPLRGGFCWFCASRAEISFTNDPNPNSFDDSQNLSDYSSQPQHETYPCESCGKDSHYDYDCPARFPLVYEQEPCYNENFSDNYYLHNSSSVLCYDNCRGPHESFHYQSINQNYFEPNPCYDSKSSCFDQFQPPQYSDVHQPSKEISIAELKMMMQSYCETMNQQHVQEALLVIQREQELLTKEQAAQEKEEPPQNSNFRQLIGEIYGTKVCEEQKKNMEGTMLELLKDCRQKELYCMHNNVDDLIESALNSKLLLINLKSQRLDKEKQEVKNIIEQSTTRSTCIIESLQNFKVIHKMSSISNTTQISLVIAIAPVLPTEEPEYSLSMGDEHLSTIPKIESDEVRKPSVEDLVPIPSEFEGILDNMCDVPFSDKNHFDAESDLIESLLTQDTLIVYSPKIDCLLKEFTGELVHINPIPPGIDEKDSNPKDDIRFIEQLLYDDTSSEDDSFEDIDCIEASPFDSELVSLEEVKDEILRAKLLNIHLLIDKIELLNNNPTPDCVLKSPSSSFLSYSDNSLLEFETFSDHAKETSSGSTTNHADNSPLEYDLFFFKIEPDQGELSSVAMEAILGEPRIYVPNVLPTQPTLYQDSDFSSFDDSFGSGLEVSFPVRTRNKIFDPGIFIEVQSERPLSREEFSISFIRDPLYPMFDTLLPFSSKNKDKVFNLKMMENASE